MTDREKIAQFVQKLANEPDLDGSLDLFASGLLSSLDVLDLIFFIESTFGISVSDEDAGMENFGTIDGIVRYVGKTAS